MSIQVHTRYGTGKWAQTTAVTRSPLGQVADLRAQEDSHTPDLVHLTWGPPTNVKGPIQVSNID